MCCEAKLAQAVDEYEIALRETIKSKSSSSKLLLKLLASRDLVAYRVEHGDFLQHEQLSRIFKLDVQFRAGAQRTLRSVILENVHGWRDSRQPPEGHWWWSLDKEPTAKSWIRNTPIILAWVLVALSLSVIVEDLRRLLAGASDGLSIAIQAVFAFVVGGTAIQYARQLLGIDKENQRRERYSGKSHILLAIGLVVAACLLEWQRPRLAARFSDQGASHRLALPSKALSDYQRASALNPDDGIAHLNLASFYDAMFDYERAEQEYLAAIRSDGAIPPAYEKLGRLAILRRRDYGTALLLFRRGLSLDPLPRDTDPDKARKEVWRYHLLVNSGWAHLGLGSYHDAEGNLREAITLNPLKASAYCLRAQVEEKEGKFAESESDKKTCVKLAGDPPPDEIEPEWWARSREPVNTHVLGRNERKQ